MTLQMRPNCECCDIDLAPDSKQAFICSFECTFCQTCVNDVLHDVCPNCGGGFMQRPTRSALKLINTPASTVRIFKPQGCAKAG